MTLRAAVECYSPECSSPRYAIGSSDDLCSARASARPISEMALFIAALRGFFSLTRSAPATICARQKVQMELLTLAVIHDTEQRLADYHQVYMVRQ